MLPLDDRILLCLLLAPMSAYTMARCLSTSQVEASDSASLLERSGWLYDYCEEGIRGDWVVMFTLSDSGRMKAQKLLERG